VLQAMAGFGRAGVRKVSLEVTAENTLAMKLYRRLGFRRAKTVYKVVEDKARAASRETATAHRSTTSQSASPDEPILSHS
jgi:ribosomal protein S18 acetylase RimI-like enzyme